MSRDRAAADVARATGRRAIAVVVDVTSTESVHAAFDQAERTLDPLDILTD